MLVRTLQTARTALAQPRTVSTETVAAIVGASTALGLTMGAQRTTESAPGGGPNSFMPMIMLSTLGTNKKKLSQE